MLSLLLLAQAVAAPVAPACPVSSPLAQWARAAPATTLTPDTPVVLAAADLAPANPKQTGRVAVATFSVTKAGTYTIAYGARGWVDVAAATGAKLNSVAHGHGTCGGVVKLVAFALTPGTYAFRGDGVTGTDVRVALLSGDQTGAAPR